MVDLMVGNAIVGIVMFEYAMKRMRSVREIIEERDSMFPAWRRLDIKRISRWRMYPIAMTIMPIRIFACIFGLIILFLLAKLCYCGRIQELKSQQTKGRRKKFMEWLLTFACNCGLFIMGTYTTTRLADTDYSEWLGADYKERY